MLAEWYDITQLAEDMSVVGRWRDTSTAAGEAMANPTAAGANAPPAEEPRRAEQAVVDVAAGGSPRESAQEGRILLRAANRREGVTDKEEKKDVVERRLAGYLERGLEFMTRE